MCIRDRAVDGSGNLYAADTANNAIRKIPLHGVSFPSINVGSSESATLTFTIWSGGAIGTPVVLTQGATGLDFTDAGTGTCTTINGAGNPYNNNATCTVNVTCLLYTSMENFSSPSWKVMAETGMPCPP